MAQSSPEPKLVFPVTCHFKIITEDLHNMHFVIETVLMQLGVHDPITPGHRSAAGKYVTYNVSIHVESRMRMDKIDRALREIVGVKMVL
jgi:putative lipoic acid-binding regulatory protein